jgi:DNA-binding transcriptional LysR family regulator
MELRDLTYFLACFDEGHLTRASQRLHVAQPTLSHALARLEAEAGERLLERPRKGRRRLSATPAGKLLAERFALAHPEVQVSLHTFAAEDIPAALAEGRIDLGLIAGAPAQVLGQLEVRQLCSEELVAIVRRDDALTKPRSLALRRLADRGFVMVLQGTFTNGLIVEACRKAGFLPKVLLRLESGEAIREVVRAGLGLTILPAGYLAEGDPTLRAVRLTHPTPKRDVHVAWDGRARPSAAARAFVEELERAVSG